MPISPAWTRRLLHVALALSIVVVAASSYLRLAGNGLGCDPWPGCYATAAAFETANQGAPVKALRLAHRVTASAFLLVAIAAVALGWRTWRSAQRLQAGALLLITIALAAIGRFTPSPLPWITWLNVLGGFALIGLTLALLAAPSASDRTMRVVPILLVLLVVQVIGGTLLSSRLTAAECQPACSHAPRGDLLALWNPQRIGDATAVAGHPGGAAVLQGVHRIGGLLLALVTLGAAALGSGARSRMLVFAAVAVLALGFAATHVPEAAVGAAHAVAAAFVLAGVAGLRRGSRAR